MEIMPVCFECGSGLEWQVALVPVVVAGPHIDPILGSA